MDGCNRGEEESQGTAPPHFLPQLPHAQYHHRLDLHSHQSLTHSAGQPLQISNGHHHHTDLSPSTDPNSRAFAANGAASTDPFPDAVNPDDFYRSYSSLQPVANAASPPSVSQSAIPARPGGQETRHMLQQDSDEPALPPAAAAAAAAAIAGSNGPRPPFRSTSNPVDDRRGASGLKTPSATPKNGYSRAAQQSVRDLTKKFDQTASPKTSSVQKPALRIRFPRDVTPASPETRPTVTRSNRSPSPAARSTASVERPSGRSAQRPDFATEDQVSVNSQSFASRINRPRKVTSTSSKASEAMAHIPIKEPSRGSAAAPPSSSRSNALLFGEISSEDNNVSTVGFGIGTARPRRTSESFITGPRKQHQRSLSDTDLEPSSPTDWYRAAPWAEQITSRSGDTRLPRPNNRPQGNNHAAGIKSTVRRPQHVPAKKHVDSSRQARSDSPASRLPLSTSAKSSSASAQESPTSTRSSSPAVGKRPPASGGRTSRQGLPLPVSRAKTPTKRSTTPTTASKAPTPSTPARKPPAQINTNGQSGRLSAYVSHPPPKLSPPLRSSRPRQSVATATTASSRLRAAENSRLAHRTDQRTTTANEASSLRRPKVSVGPIDFARRRETIKLAYSKSIRETQAREVRQAAAERRRKELEAVARAKAEAEAAAIAAITMQENAEHSTAQPGRSPHPGSRSREPPLRIDTDLPPAQPLAKQVPTSLDSPTLGMPGSFPAALEPVHIEQDDIPRSAASATTAITEFDAEPQTEPPIQEAAVVATVAADVLGASSTPDNLDESSDAHPPRRRKASYHYPFDEEGMNDGSVSIKISLSASPTQETAQLSTSPQGLGGEVGHPVRIPPRQEQLEHSHACPDTHNATAVTFAPVTAEPVPPELDVALVDESAICDEDEPTGQAEAYQVNSEAHVPALADTFRTHADGDVRDGHDDVGDAIKAEDYYLGLRVQDNAAALRGSTAGLSDHQPFSSEEPAAGEEEKRTPDVPHSLTVPVLLSPGNRLSQASAWTDFSLGSSDDRDASGQSLPASALSAGTHGQDPVAHSQAVGIAISQDSSYEYIAEYPETTPDYDLKDVVSLIRPPSARSVHKLPELDTGASFSVPYAPKDPGTRSHLYPMSDVERDDSASARWRQEDSYSSSEPHRGDASPVPPHHAPPLPPPPPSDEYQLEESAYYTGTRPSSYLHSHDEESDYLALATSASPTFDEILLGIHNLQASQQTAGASATPSSDVHTPTDKEQKRLKQRQLVIKELIDTEAAFVRDMSVVEEIYKGTAEACPRLDAQTVKIIFRNTDEIISFHTAFLSQLKEGVSDVYVAKSKRPPLSRQPSAKELVAKESDAQTEDSTISSGTSQIRAELDDGRDRQSSIGPVFSRNIEKMKVTHEGYLRTSDSATKRLIQIQEDPTVNVWLNECNEVAKDLTAAWNLDSLLIKPMQRITKYPNLISQLLEHTPLDHPDREALVGARAVVEDAILEINKTKKNFELVGQIVSRKRKESDVRAGIARAFGKRVDKLQASGNRPPEDEEYLKLHEKFGDDYLRLQVVLRDVEYYTRTTTSYVHEFLQYASSMELVMRLQPSKNHSHLESKWVQFNVSMRAIEKVLEQHLVAVRRDVIEPFEQVIKCYGNPSLAMKKRAKRRLDYEKYTQLKASGKKIDKQLGELVEHYEALNETLKKELPRLSALTAKVGNVCLAKFVAIQAEWFAVWKDKVKAPLQGMSHIPETSEIVASFRADHRLMEEEAMTISILNPSLRPRVSQSTTDDAGSTMSRTISRPSDVGSRSRGLSVNSDTIPSLPTPEVLQRNSSSQFAFSPNVPSPAHSYYRDYYTGINGYPRGAASPATSEVQLTSRPLGASGRPSTDRSFEPAGAARPSIESTQHSVRGRRDSSSTYNSPFLGSEARRFSGLFHSALPPSDGPEESQRLSRATSRASRASRASSRDRNALNGGYNVLWLAASLFEFNIETTKHEAGYPYLTYQAGEIFDVIAEKGELWLAKNQDDPLDQVGWIWSKHFAKLADS